MAGSDVRTKRITATGSMGVGPVRIRQMQVLTTTGTPRLTITNGSGGAVAIDLDFKASDIHSVNIPAEGVRVDDVFVTDFTAITAVTVFFN